MTPVAPFVALCAMTWDAALVETLSRAAEPRSVSAVPAIVHSVHQRAANILVGDTLIAVISSEFDDAPSTIRLAVDDWRQLRLQQGDEVTLTATSIRFPAESGGQEITLRDAEKWTPAPADLSGLRVAELAHAAEALEAFTGDVPPTPFGRASSALLHAGVDQLRAASAALSFSPDATETDAGVVAAVGRLVGLGEGLTPSGDDILTGLTFLAAQPGMTLNRLIPSLAAGIDAHASRTTLLSVVTMRAAVAGRGRQSMHDLARALELGDPHALHDAVAQILAIGHSSGADLLTGMRLALKLESRARATMPAANRKRSA